MLVMARARFLLMRWTHCHHHQWLCWYVMAQYSWHKMLHWGQTSLCQATNRQLAETSPNNPRVQELGTYCGYSTVLLAAHLTAPGARVYTLVR